MSAALNESYSSLNVLGVNFINESVERCIDIVSRGGLLVVPSGPGLATLDRDSAYKEAVECADFALADSGYLVLLLRFFKRRRVARISGLRFMDELLNNKAFRECGNTLWVMPRAEEIEPAKRVLEGREVAHDNLSFCVAPFYSDPGNLVDPELLAKLESERPSWVILNIAGGKQEKLGLYLRRNLSYSPAIVCTGAAIAFLSGEQAYIPSWVDRFYLGWLARIVQSPKRYLTRYLEATLLVRKIAFNPDLSVESATRKVSTASSTSS